MNPKYIKYDELLAASKLLSAIKDIKDLEMTLLDLNEESRESHRRNIMNRVNELYTEYSTKLSGTPEEVYLNALRAEYDRPTAEPTVLDIFDIKTRNLPLSTRTKNRLGYRNIIDTGE